MKPENLVHMANQIGKFFQYQRKDEIVPGIANHIKKFWEPRMRTAIFAYIDQGGDGLDPLVKEAIVDLKERGEVTESSFRGTEAS